ncbi:MAG: SDR family NAD(P)-dependent oxidoreductase [SAR324 cluster bacterium]|nr:SDR family NAD(P)-dependent oxidoreductase [SAR324 cluster bacterium]MCZ6531368.1 SDR family NAD(P)-dependent oxidoreductase [SAR324 cluster bacterium]MCZ6559198.1 SDR family NAD(P)-dependent oxidoreductase [SAR324 cluster bacterium]MCZ6627519.1 SDR family NAD(P)-dependent oxidoreductase [SAR324 cluster bacterium]MCZ6646865.1 SDR family NAD(P)-dependent oxidoreductase [SAR324 cluster bacterium]
MKDGKIFITGASSGIGKALAEALAVPDCTLGLAARRMERLQQLKGELEARGATVFVYQVDVRDAKAMEQAVDAFANSAGGITHMIANAGVKSGGRLAGGTAERLTDVFAVNVIGVINSLVPAANRMVEQQSGHLVSIGSVAGFRGIPGRSDYNASKSAVQIMMDGFRLELRAQGVKVTNICPGFVESEMTGTNNFHMPFFLKADKAARLIVKAIQRNKKTYIFPWQWRVLLPIIVRLPDWLVPQVR